MGGTSFPNAAGSAQNTAEPTQQQPQQPTPQAPQYNAAPPTYAPYGGGYGYQPYGGYGGYQPQYQQPYQGYSPYYAPRPAYQPYGGYQPYGDPYMQRPQVSPYSQAGGFEQAFREFLSSRGFAGGGIVNLSDRWSDIDRSK